MRPIWHRFTHHPFVQGLGDGTLPLKNFKDYLVQDYLYLVSLHVSYFVSMPWSTNSYFPSGPFRKKQCPRFVQSSHHEIYSRCKSPFVPPEVYIELISYTVRKNSPTYQHRNSPPYRLLRQLRPNPRRDGSNPRKTRSASPPPLPLFEPY